MQCQFAHDHVRGTFVLFLADLGGDKGRRGKFSHVKKIGAHQVPRQLAVVCEQRTHVDVQ